MGKSCTCGRHGFVPESLETRLLLADISGVVFNDINGDGVRQASETAAANRAVFVDANNNGQLDAGERTARTDFRGTYRFTGVPSGRFTIRQILPAESEQTLPVGSASGSFYAGRPAGSGLKINILAGPTLSVSSTALVTIRSAAAQWARFFSDPITVNVDMELFPLGQDGLLGATSLSEVTVPYNQARDALVASSFPDEAFARQTPLAGNIHFRAPVDDMTPWRFAGNIQAPRANLMALGFTPAELHGPESAYAAGRTIDGSIYLNSEAGFDLNPKDGVAPGKTDLYSTVLHELGHVLGFDSVVDTVDFVAPESDHILTPSPMDLFRLKPGAGAAGFSTATRLWTNGQDAPLQVFYDGGKFDPAGLKIPGLKRGDIPMSTGASSGDGNQASHWKDDQLAGRFIGVMDPTLDRNFTTPTANDIRALGLIGWDVRQPLAGRVVSLASASASATGQNFGVRGSDSDDQLFEARFAAAGKTIASQSIGGGDVDLFAIRGRKSQTYAIKVAGALGLDPAIRVFDAGGVELAATPKLAPRPVAGATATLSFTLPRDGTFYFGVSGRGNAAYNVVTGSGDHVGSVGVYAVTVANQTLDTDGRIAIATTLQLGQKISSDLSPACDVDIYKITVKAGQRIGFDIDVPSGAATDTYLRVFDSTGHQLQWNDDAPAPGEGWTFESALAFTFTSAGTYYIGISSTGNATYDPMTGAGEVYGIEGAYSLTATLLT